METPRIILFVGLEPQESAETQKLADWLDKVHMPEVCKAPGIKTGARYELKKANDNSPKYLAIYELEGEEGVRKYEAFKDAQNRGEIAPFTPGPPFRVVWKTIYKYY